MDIPAGSAASGSLLPWSRWLEVDDATLMQLLEEHGQDINTLESSQNDADGHGPNEQQDSDDGEVVPLAGGWLRLAAGDDGDLLGQRVSDPVEQHPVDAPVVFAETDIDGLRGWMTQGRDLSVELGWWCRLLRDPERERYAVAVHRWGDPEPGLVLVGLYPDVALCQAESPVVVFVEPHPNEPGRARARLLPVTTTSLHDPPRVLAEGPAAGVKVEACSVRRFVKVGHGVRSNRIWQVFDLTAPQLQPIAVPEPVRDPDLCDVAPLEVGMCCSRRSMTLSTGVSRPARSVTARCRIGGRWRSGKGNSAISSALTRPCSRVSVGRRAPATPRTCCGYP